MILVVVDVVVVVVVVVVVKVVVVEVVVVVVVETVVVGKVAGATGWTGLYTAFGRLKGSGWRVLAGFDLAANSSKAGLQKGHSGT